MADVTSLHISLARVNHMITLAFNSSERCNSPVERGEWKTLQTSKDPFNISPKWLPNQQLRPQHLSKKPLLHSISSKFKKVLPQVGYKSPWSLHPLVLFCVLSMGTNLVIFYGTAPQRSETAKHFYYFSCNRTSHLFSIILFFQLPILIINFLSIPSVLQNFLHILARSDVF